MKSTTRNRFALTVGAIGVLAAIMTTAMAPALSINATSAAPIVSAKKVGPIALTGSDATLVTIKVPAGKWLITGTMWADSVASQPTNTVVGCSIWKGSTALDNSAFNTPKIGGAGGTAAGVNAVSAVVTLRARATIAFKCSDFGSHANAHSVVLSAIG
jgi:hypothetical protein